MLVATCRYVQQNSELTYWHILVNQLSVVMFLVLLFIHDMYQQAPLIILASLSSCTSCSVFTCVPCICFSVLVILVLLFRQYAAYIVISSIGLSSTLRSGPQYTRNKLEREVVVTKDVLPVLWFNETAHSSSSFPVCIMNYRLFLLF